MSTFGFNSGYVEDMYAQFLENPESVSESWREFFADFQPGPTFRPRRIDVSVAEPGQPADSPVTAPPSGDGAAPPEPDVEKARKAPRPPSPRRPDVDVAEGATVEPLRGVGAKIVENMEASLTIPTATSVREIPTKLMAENRRLMNRRQQATGGEKISFTHIIAYAIIQGLAKYPGMNATFRYNEEGKPERIDPEGSNLGLAIDIEKNGKRQLLVPNVKAVQKLSFAEFLGAYNGIIKRARVGDLEVDDFLDTTATLTNPGMIGTAMSVPRLMPGQGVIIGVGSIGFPPEYAGMSQEELSRLGLSEVMTITSTYDHRVIQGAESGEFLRHVSDLLTGKLNFYNEIFRSLGIHTPPLRMEADTTPNLGRRGVASDRSGAAEKQASVLQFIRAYRVRGHLLADTNPLHYESRLHTELDPASYGLTVWDLDRVFITGRLAGKEKLPLRDILDILWDTYAGHIGTEFMHISSPDEKRWLVERIEPQQFRENISVERKKRIFEKLNAAEALEQFIHTKYIGHKRFSLEGAETMIPILDAIVTDAADQEVEEVVIGMAHRGRLNVLTNIIGKPYNKVFDEFEGTIDADAVQGSGDVKYHLGQEGVHVTPNGSSIKLSLASNPSHLEAVNPVVEGMVRAKQQRVMEEHSDLPEKSVRDRVIPILLHGDAAFAGQGVVAETLNLSQLEGYRTGGTIHLVVNNQIGFTTLPLHARSSAYATDIARMIQAPIFHVNGDDPEAAIRVARLALDYRQVFNKDVVIDLICYRKYGHNEGDEPSYTQPLMYADIKDHRSVRKVYMEHLLRRGEITPEDAEALLDDFRDRLNQAFEETKELAEKSKDINPIAAAAKKPTEEEIQSIASREALERTITALVDLPDDFAVHKKLDKQIQRRREQFEDGSIDWALAEALAFGTLLQEGSPVRISGQDSGRGTFSQRHAILYDQNDAHHYIPLNHVSSDQARFQVYDSLLSEYAALGFEYGYSVSEPDALVCWEAQFGDFVNGGQIMIDQFIAAAEAKWSQTSRLTMLLPHGYEGQGPEHSSGRLERFLQACAENNMIVANYSTPANYFHALRRQVKRKARKPLVVMTPKSLLRHPQAVCSAEDLSDRPYQPFIPAETDPGTAARLVLCSGKVYYDLTNAREELDQPERVAIARLEQFYPFPEDAVRAEFTRFQAAEEIFWLQEEPANMGAWTFLRPLMNEILENLTGDCSKRIRYVGRKAAASPATGSATVHAAEQEAILKQALGS